MNTGMQDAFNLAWKLALVVRGAGPDSLLDSYSLERSYVGDGVLKAAERLTAVATLRNPVEQGLRNLAGHLVLGLPFFAQGVAENMSETAVHYPQSPLNGPHVRASLQPANAWRRALRQRLSDRVHRQVSPSSQTRRRLLRSS